MRSVQTGNSVTTGSVGRKANAEAVFDAPAGTRFASVRWSGKVRRVDCRYALQMWAEVPNAAPVPILNVRSNEGCPKRGRAQAKDVSARELGVNGATRIVQRVTCVPARGKTSCSSRNSNFVRTDRLELLIEDVAPPTVAIDAGTALGRAEWVAGAHQHLDYVATDNAGVDRVTAAIAGAVAGWQTRPCRPADNGVFDDLQPCVDGAGQIDVDTTRTSDGTHELVVHAQDVAGNVATSQAVAARVDNTAPERIDVAVTGESGWRNHSDVELSWTNRVETDRAPIVAAVYKLCPAAGGECRTGEQTGVAMSRLGLSVPSPGQWTASVWLRDAAGNQNSGASSVPVSFGYDPERPKLEFEPASPADPTLVAVRMSDAISGIADGAIEIGGLVMTAATLPPCNGPGQPALVETDGWQ